MKRDWLADVVVALLFWSLTRLPSPTEELSILALAVLIGLVATADQFRIVPRLQSRAPSLLGGVITGRGYGVVVLLGAMSLLGLGVVAAIGGPFSDSPYRTPLVLGGLVAVSAFAFLISWENGPNGRPAIVRSRENYFLEILYRESPLVPAWLYRTAPIFMPFFSFAIACGYVWLVLTTPEHVQELNEAGLALVWLIWVLVRWRNPPSWLRRLQRASDSVRRATLNGGSQRSLLVAGLLTLVMCAIVPNQTRYVASNRRRRHP